MKNNDEIKIILLGGASGVGTTSLIDRFCGKEFTQFTESSISGYSLEFELNYKKKSYKYCIWDSGGGQEKFNTIKKMFLNGSNIILIVYSIVDRISFEGAEYWIKNVKELKEREKDDKYILVLIANKCDLFPEQRVADGEGENLAKKYGIECFITSARDISESFKELVNKLIINYIEKRYSNPSLLEKYKPEQTFQSNLRKYLNKYINY